MSVPRLAVDAADVTPGDPTAVAFTLTGGGDRPTTYRVRCVGLPADWVQTPFEVGPVAPGATVVGQLVVTLPAGHPPAALVGSLVATGDDGGPDLTADLQVAVGDGTVLAAAIDPPTVRAARAGRLSVVLRNRSAAPVHAVLSTMSTPDVAVRLARSSTVLPPGGEVRLRGRVAARATLRGNRQHIYAIRVQGKGSPVMLQGAFVQRALIGPFFLKLFAVATVVALWAAVAVVGISTLSTKLKKTTHTTATASAPAPVPPKPSAGGGTGSGSAAAGGGGAAGAAGAAGGSGKGGSGAGAAGAAGGSGAAGAGAPGGTPGAGQVTRVSGKVKSPQPGGVTVTIASTSLVDEKAQAANFSSAGGVAPVAATQAAVRTDTGPIGKVYGTLISDVAAQTLAATRNPPVTTTTAPDGSFAFAGVKAPGYYLVTFSKPGYATTRYVVTAAAGTAATLDATLTPGDGAVSGTVTGPSGPLGGVTLTVSDGTTTTSTTTPSVGAVGTWAVQGLSTPGTYLVTATAPGFGPQVAVEQLGAGGTVSGVGLTMARSVGTLQGRVVQSLTAAGVPGVTVTATSGSTTATATTLTAGDLAGTFTLPNLALGQTYALTVSGPGIATVTQQVQLLAGTGPVTITAMPATYDVVGTVQGPAGGTAGLVLTNATTTLKTLTASVPSTTGHGADFDFGQVAPGTYLLNATAAGFAPFTTQVVVAPGVASPDLAITMQPTAATTFPTTGGVTGAIVDLVTQKVPGCSATAPTCTTPTPVTVTLDQGATSTTTAVPGAAACGGLACTTTASGSYTINGIAPGEHTLSFQAAGYQPVTLKVNVGATGTTSAPIAQLPELDSIGANAIDANGAAVQVTSACAVPVDTSITTKYCWDSTHPDPANLAKDGINTYANGGFEIDDVPPGNYDLHVSATGQRPGQAATPVQPDYVDFTLRNIVLNIDEKLLLTDGQVHLTQRPYFTVSTTKAVAGAAAPAPLYGVTVTATPAPGAPATATTVRCTTYDPAKYAPTPGMPAPPAGACTLLPGLPRPPDMVASPESLGALVAGAQYSVVLTCSVVTSPVDCAGLQYSPSTPLPVFTAVNDDTAIASTPASTQFPLALGTLKKTAFLTMGYLVQTPSGPATCAVVDGAPAAGCPAWVDGVSAGGYDLTKVQVTATGAAVGGTVDLPFTPGAGWKLPAMPIQAATYPGDLTLTVEPSCSAATPGSCYAFARTSEVLQAIPAADGYYYVPTPLSLSVLPVPVAGTVDPAAGVAVAVSPQATTPQSGVGTAPLSVSESSTGTLVWADGTQPSVNQALPGRYTLSLAETGYDTVHADNHAAATQWPSDGQGAELVVGLCVPGSCSATFDEVLPKHHSFTVQLPSDFQLVAGASAPVALVRVTPVPTDPNSPAPYCRPDPASTAGATVVTTLTFGATGRDPSTGALTYANAFVTVPDIDPLAGEMQLDVQVSGYESFLSHDTNCYATSTPQPYTLTLGTPTAPDPAHPDWVLEPQGVIEGTVTGHTGTAGATALPGITVSLGSGTPPVGTAAKATCLPTLNTTTGADGGYQFAALPDASTYLCQGYTYTVSINTPGYVPFSTTVVAGGPPTPITPLVAGSCPSGARCPTDVLLAHYTLTLTLPGNFVAVRGAPAPIAQVTDSGRVTTYIFTAVGADQNGPTYGGASLSVPDFAAAKIVGVTISATGWHPYTTTSATAGTSDPSAYVIAPAVAVGGLQPEGVITGTVTSAASGTVLAGSQVDLIAPARPSCGATPSTDWSTTAGPDGSFQFIPTESGVGDICAGDTYTLQVEHTGFAISSKSFVPAGPTDPEVGAVVALAPFSLLVSLPASLPLAPGSPAPVLVVDAGGATQTIPFQSTNVAADQSLTYGGSTVAVPAFTGPALATGGGYASPLSYNTAITSVTLLAGGYQATALPLSVATTSDQATFTIAAQPAPTGVVTGTVVDVTTLGAGGQQPPLQGATVTLTGPTNVKPVPPACAGPFTATSAANGSFTLVAAPSATVQICVGDTYTLTVHTAGYADFSQAITAAGPASTTPVVVTLTRYSLTLTLPNPLPLAPGAGAPVATVTDASNVTTTFTFPSTSTGTPSYAGSSVVVPGFSPDSPVTVGFSMLGYQALTGLHSPATQTGVAAYTVAAVTTAPTSTPAGTAYGVLQPVGVISGTVLSTTGSPLPGATVTVTGPTNTVTGCVSGVPAATTDATGSFELVSTPSSTTQLCVGGDYDVKVQLSGYADYDYSAANTGQPYVVAGPGSGTPLQVTLAGYRETVQLPADFSLLPGSPPPVAQAVDSNKVTTSLAFPVVGVGATAYAGAKVVVPGFSATNPVTVTLDLPGYREAVVASPTIVAGQSAYPETPTLTAVGVAVGTVQGTNPGGTAALSGATVELVGPQVPTTACPAVDVTALTGTNGSFQIFSAPTAAASICPGVSYELKAAAPAGTGYTYSTYDNTAFVPQAPGALKPATITLSSYSLTVTLPSPLPLLAGANAPAARVTANGSTTTLVFPPTGTDANNAPTYGGASIAVPGFVPSTAGTAVTITALGYVPATYTVTTTTGATISGNSYSLVISSLTPSGVVTGTVTGATSGGGATPLHGATVSLAGPTDTYTGTGTDPCPTGTFTATTAGDGSFQIVTPLTSTVQICPGRLYTLTTTDAGYLADTRTGVTPVASTSSGPSSAVTILLNQVGLAISLPTSFVEVGSAAPVVDLVGNGTTTVVPFPPSARDATTGALQYAGSSVTVPGYTSTAPISVTLIAAGYRVDPVQSTTATQSNGSYQLTLPLEPAGTVTGQVT
ncbi:MAG TPA: carboxypeptidase regulatory-like domain-containing protein, partial [Acidimicrobiales bacterium]|nr:carboxypeptidase regulatory-like domain-containing protein [Acidimicrobiales bacterium]